MVLCEWNITETLSEVDGDGGTAVMDPEPGVDPRGPADPGTWTIVADGGEDDDDDFAEEGGDEFDDDDDYEESFDEFADDEDFEDDGESDDEGDDDDDL